MRFNSFYCRLGTTEVRPGKAFLEPHLRSSTLTSLHFAFVLTAATAGPSKGHNCQNSQGGRFSPTSPAPPPLFCINFFFLLISMGRSSNTRDSNSDEAAEGRGYQKDHSAWSLVCQSVRE